MPYLSWRDLHYHWLVVVDLYHTHCALRLTCLCCNSLSFLRIENVRCFRGGSLFLTNSVGAEPFCRPTYLWAGRRTFTPCDFFARVLMRSDLWIYLLPIIPLLCRLLLSYDPLYDWLFCRHYNTTVNIHSDMFIRFCHNDASRWGTAVLIHEVE